MVHEVQKVHEVHKVNHLGNQPDHMVGGGGGGV